MKQFLIGGGALLVLSLLSGISADCYYNEESSKSVSEICGKWYYYVKHRDSYPLDTTCERECRVVYIKNDLLGVGRNATISYQCMTSNVMQSQEIGTMQMEDREEYVTLKYGNECK